MLAVLGLLFYFLFVFVIAYRGLFFIIMLMSILLAYSWRAISAFYIEISPNLYEKDLYDYIDSQDCSTLVLVSYFIIIYIIISIIFSPKYIEDLKEMIFLYRKREVFIVQTKISNLIIYCIAIFIIIVYSEVTVIGFDLPLFTGEERGNFQKTFLMGVFLKYQSFIFMLLGVGYYTSVNNKNFKFFTITLYLSLIFYLILLGNKFSALFLNTAFFLLPISLSVIDYRFPLKNSIIDKRNIKLISLGVLILFSLLGLKYAQVRFDRNIDYDNSIDYLQRRIFIQQNMLFSDAFHRLYVQEVSNSSEAIQSVFFSPFNEAKGTNTSVQYLMYKQLNESVFKVFRTGVQYTGAFPQILVELFGITGSYLIVALCAIFTALLIKIFFNMIIRKNYLTMLMSFFLLQPILIFLISGKMVILMQVQTYLKLSLFLLFYAYEERLLLRLRK